MQRSLGHHVASTLMLLGAMMFCVLMTSQPAAAQNRIALILTNQAYTQPGARLTNPHRDGEVLKAALEKVGFKVWLARDTKNEGELLRAIGEHIERMTRAGPDAVGFLYYSGHGAADRPNGDNYLIPTEAPLTSAAQLPLMAVRLDKITGTLSSVGAMSFVVFDACRNVPLQRGIRDSTFKGFAPVREQNNLLVAFATDPGNVAIDENVYAGALAEELVRPGLEAAQVFRRVRQKVRDGTSGKQLPEYVDKREHDFHFATGGAVVAALPQTSTPPDLSQLTTRSPVPQPPPAKSLPPPAPAPAATLPATPPRTPPPAKQASLAPSGRTPPGRNEHFIPLLVYRTGAYALNGIPMANGTADYLRLINERDGGINGVRLAFEECETGYATDKGVECYERLKRMGPAGAAYVSPLSTGINFALTEKAPTDKIPLLSVGSGRPESVDGKKFPWNFPGLGTAWAGAEIAIHHIAKELGGPGNLRGKTIALIYHDSPFGKEPISVLEERAKDYGFSLKPMPVTHPGVEQKSQWLAVRQARPDYVLLWGWGVMNATAIKEAAAVGYPRDKILGYWWSGAEPDVLPAGANATGFKAIALHSAGKFPVHADIERHVIAKGSSATDPGELGQVFYNRGLLTSVIGVEAIRTAMKKFGHKPMTGEQVRWGLENLELTQARLVELGIAGMIQPVKFSCSFHDGQPNSARVQQWDGKSWNVISDLYAANYKREVC